MLVGSDCEDGLGAAVVIINSIVLSNGIPNGSVSACRTTLSVGGGSNWGTSIAGFWLFL